MDRPLTTSKGDVSIAAYAAAHFGKSLWWNGSELFLAFYLTEYLKLAGVMAGLVIAVGLVAGASFDIIVARRSKRFASVPRAGRVQLAGASASLVSLLLMLGALLLAGGGRLAIIFAASLLFRLAYVFYDLPQNCLLGLIDWSPEQRRLAAAARTAAGAAALVVTSALIEVRGGAALSASVVIVVAIAIAALGSAVWLWRQTRVIADHISAPASASYASIVRPLTLMVIVTLTVPVFSKLAPYLVSYAPQMDGAALLLTAAAMTAASQPLWLLLLRRRGEAVADGIAGIVLIAGAAFAMAGHLTIASGLIGLASGGLSTVIWGSFATAVAGRDPLQAAPAFALLVAAAKVALAVAAIGMGLLLDAADYRHDGTVLLPFMVLIVMIGGIAVMLHAAFGIRIRDRRLAGAISTKQQG